MTSSVVESSAMSTRSTPRKRPQMNSFVTPMRLSSKTATSLTPAAALAEIDTPPLVAFQTTDDKSMKYVKKIVCGAFF